MCERRQIAAHGCVSTAIVSHRQRQKDGVKVLEQRGFALKVLSPLKRLLLALKEVVARRREALQVITRRVDTRPDKSELSRVSTYMYHSTYMYQHM